MPHKLALATIEELHSVVSVYPHLSYTSESEWASVGVWEDWREYVANS